jgi:hypothetical protein
MATVLTWCFSFQMGHTSEMKYQRLHIYTDFFTDYTLINVAEAASVKQTGQWPNNSGIQRTVQKWVCSKKSQLAKHSY